LRYKKDNRKDIIFTKPSFLPPSKKYKVIVTGDCKLLEFPLKLSVLRDDIEYESDSSSSD